MAAVQLAAAPAPLAVLPSFIAEYPTTLIMKEQVFSISDDAFTVKTLDGRDVLKITADTFSLSARKRVHDPAGNHLFTLRKEIFSFPKSYFAESPTGTKIFEVEGKFHLGTSKAIGHFVNAMNGEQESFLMHGSFFNVKTQITNEKNGQVVAQIDRDLWNARQLLADRESYAVTIAPGVDIALIVAMVVCLDERRDQKTGHHGI
jgi:uncharacterized protein YxjI